MLHFPYTPNHAGQMKQEVEALKHSGTVQTMAMQSPEDGKTADEAAETETIQPPTA